MADQLDSALQSPRDVRMAIRHDDLHGPTSGLAPGYLQANLVIVPQRLGVRLPAVLPAQPEAVPAARRDRAGRPRAARLVAPGADLRTDLPRYRVCENGELVDEPTDVARCWRDDLVAFLSAARSRFENALLRAGVPVRHIEQGRNVPMYRTNIACRPAGIVSRADGRVDAAADAGAGDRRRRRDLRAVPAGARRAGPLSATRPPSASRDIDAARTSATRSRSGPARCRCSGRAA